MYDVSYVKDRKIQYFYVTKKVKLFERFVGFRFFLYIKFFYFFFSIATPSVPGIKAYVYVRA